MQKKDGKGENEQDRVSDFLQGFLALILKILAVFFIHKIFDVLLHVFVIRCSVGSNGENNYLT